MLRAWRDGRFSLIASPALLDELARALSYPKLRKRIPSYSADAVLDLLARGATMVKDVADPRAARSISATTTCSRWLNASVPCSSRATRTCSL